jgi:hypothetical protein
VVFPPCPIAGSIAGSIAPGRRRAAVAGECGLSTVVCASVPVRNRRGLRRRVGPGASCVVFSSFIWRARLVVPRWCIAALGGASLPATTVVVAQPPAATARALLARSRYVDAIGRSPSEPRKGWLAGDRQPLVTAQSTGLRSDATRRHNRCGRVRRSTAVRLASGGRKSCRRHGRMAHTGFGVFARHGTVRTRRGAVQRANPILCHGAISRLAH